MNTNAQTLRPTATTRPPLKTGWKAVISIVLVLHLTAVVAAPMVVGPRSGLAEMTFEFFRPYLDAAYLNHGYHFFGPDPGPSHLVRYVVEKPDGTTVEGVFPNRDEHWPRLLYHRHFMLTERLAAGPDNDPWIKAFAQSYARHVYTLHGAKSVELFLRRHHMPRPDQVLGGMKLDDPSLYEERELVRYTGESP
jgi:hypothetical protein